MSADPPKPAAKQAPKQAAKSEQDKAVEAIRAAGVPADANIAAGLPTEDEVAAAGDQDGRESPTYSVARLLAEPQILGESVADIAGGLYDLDEGEELTEAEARGKIDSFREREVQTDQTEV